jgi:uncharacterized membrane protein YebE (DUF533 family)
MLDARKLLGEMLRTGRALADGARAKVQAEIRGRLGDDPLASIQAMGRAAVEKLGPEARRAAATAGSLAGEAMAKAREGVEQASATFAKVKSALGQPSPEQAKALLLVRAMIAAAKADGEVDAEERARITAALEAAGASEDARAFVDAELAKPMDLYAITAEVRDAATAAEVYAAAAAVIRIDTEAERAWLAQLAARLGLDRNAVDTIHGRLGLPLPV